MRFKSMLVLFLGFSLYGCTAYGGGYDNRYPYPRYDNDYYESRSQVYILPRGGYYYQSRDPRPPRYLGWQRRPDWRQAPHYRDRGRHERPRHGWDARPQYRPSHGQWPQRDFHQPRGEHRFHR